MNSGTYPRYNLLHPKYNVLYRQIFDAISVAILPQRQGFDASVNRPTPSVKTLTAGGAAKLPAAPYLSKNTYEIFSKPNLGTLAT